MCAWRQSGIRPADATAGAAERRALGLLLEGVAINQIQIDPEAHRRFRSAILRNSIRLAEPQSQSDLLNIVGQLVHEFETYSLDCESILQSRQKEWHAITSMLLRQLPEAANTNPQSDLWAGIDLALCSAVTTEEIAQLRERLQQVLQQSSEDSAARKAKIEEEQDQSKANDNAAGLRGGGAAIEHVRAMIESQRPGYVGLFRLNCLDVVGERFGPEGIQDCLMAVSAFLIQSLRSEDSIYHWSESTLLAVCDRKIREDLLAADFNRVLARNRDFTIKIGDRNIMLRIPIELELFPLAIFHSADDLQKLRGGRGSVGRALSERAIARLNS